MSLTGISELQCEEITEDWRKLHKIELYNSSSVPHGRDSIKIFV
jgi:hypothetical protein